MVSNSTNVHSTFPLGRNPCRSCLRGRVGSPAPRFLWTLIWKTVAEAIGLEDHAMSRGKKQGKGPDKSTEAAPRSIVGRKGR